MNDTVKMIKGKHNGTYLSVISFPFNFQSNLREVNKFNMVLIQQPFKELRDWGEISSESSSLDHGQRTARTLELLLDIVVKPSSKKFEDWFITLYESEIFDFMAQFAEAKEHSRKK